MRIINDLSVLSLSIFMLLVYAFCAAAVVAAAAYIRGLIAPVLDIS